jgi:hypothetical protein
LLHRRALFADVERFVLYDFFTPDGSVDENVFAYSNQHAGERALVVYHNRFAATRGWIRTSVAALMPGPDGARALRQTTLGDSLELSGDADAFLIFRDQVTGLEYLRRCRDLREKGLYVELDAYKRHLFLDFRQARDDAQRRYARLEEALDGRGVPSVAEALQELLLQSILQPFRELMNVDLLSRLIAAQAAAQDAAQGAAQDAAQAVESAEKPAAGLAALPADEPTAEPDAAALADEVERKMLDLLRAVRQFARGAADEAPIAREARRGLELLLEPIPALPPDSPAAPALDYLREQAPAELAAPAAGFAWLFVRGLGRVAGEDGHAERSRAWIDEWKLGRTMSDALRELGLNDSGAASAVALVKILAAWQGWHRLPLDAAAGPAFRQVLETALRDADVRAYLGINRYRDILWFNKEAFERLVWWLMRAACVGLDGATGAEDQARLASAYRVAQALLRAEQQSEYQVEKLLAAAL